MKVVTLNLLIVSVYLAYEVGAAEIEGVVESVNGQTIHINSESEQFPIAGDKLVVSTKVPGTDIFAGVGVGTVTKTEGTRIIAKIDRASGRVEVGQSVSITSNNPVRRPHGSESPKGDSSSSIRTSIPSPDIPATDETTSRSNIPYVERLQGEWICVKTTFEGEDSDQFIDVRARFAGKKMTWRYPLPDGTMKEQECEFRVDESKRPPHFNWWTVAKPESVRLRIFEFVDKDTTRWATNISTIHRPDSFDDARYVFLMKRIPSDSPALSTNNTASASNSQVVRTITNTIGMQFNLLPAGEFDMGNQQTLQQLRTVFGRTVKVNDELPAHRVKISRAFYMGQHEVTKGQFRRFVDSTSYRTTSERSREGGRGYDGYADEFKFSQDYSWRNPGFEQTEDHPVVNVSWSDAVAFCDWLSELEDRKYRLPTEAEWEYACRAGKADPFSVELFNAGGSEYQDHRDANLKARNERERKLDGRRRPDLVSSSSGGGFGLVTGGVYIAWRDDFIFTAPVGRCVANAFGLHDMHGNVLEICNDWWSGKYNTEDSTDPAGASTGTWRVVRGGSWADGPAKCRSSARFGARRGQVSVNLGFRIVLESK